VADPWRSGFATVPRLENEGFKNFMHNSLAVAITVDSVLDYGLLPFRLQLHVATLQLDIFVYNCMWQHYMGLRFERWLPAFPFVTFSGRSLAVRIHSCAALRKRRLSEFFPKFVGRYNYSGLRLGLRLPAFSFTITCGNLTVGHFRLQLHVAALHWDYVLNDGFPLFRLQMHVTTRFFSVGCPGSRGNLPESCSGKLTQGVTIGLLKKSQLMKSIIGILLNPSGKVVCISELTFLADSGILALTLQNFQCYSERGLPTALFWIFHLDIYGGMRWMHLCPRG